MSTLKNTLIVSILLLGINLMAQDQKILDQFNVSLEQFNYYDSLNQVEERLIDYKDSDSVLIVKINQLHYINESRNKYKANPVKLDIFASRVANKQCVEAGENEYVAHWNLRGEKPYHRYGLAGGAYHVTENAHGAWDTRGFEQSLFSMSTKMMEGHDDFMKERKPNDGHKQNIIDKIHTSVGIGVYLNQTQFRYYEEFLDEYLKINNINYGDKSVSINFTPNEGYYVYVVMVSYDKIKSKSVKQLNSSGGYFDQGDQVVESFRIEQMKQSDGSYQFDFSEKKPGAYYIQVFISDKEPKSNGMITTKGTFSALGVVIEI